MDQQSKLSASKRDRQIGTASFFDASPGGYACGNTLLCVATKDDA